MFYILTIIASNRDKSIMELQCVDMTKGGKIRLILIGREVAPRSQVMEEIILPYKQKCSVALKAKFNQLVYSKYAAQIGANS